MTKDGLMQLALVIWEKNKMRDGSQISLEDAALWAVRFAEKIDEVFALYEIEQSRPNELRFAKALDKQKRWQKTLATREAARLRMLERARKKRANKKLNAELGGL